MLDGLYKAVYNEPVPLTNTVRAAAR
jgi:hypothetical protein